MADLRKFLGSAVLHFSSVDSVSGFAMLDWEVNKEVTNCVATAENYQWRFLGAPNAEKWCHKVIMQSCFECHDANSTLGSIWRKLIGPVEPGMEWLALTRLEESIPEGGVNLHAICASDKATFIDHTECVNGKVREEIIREKEARESQQLAATQRESQLFKKRPHNSP